MPLNQALLGKEYPPVRYEVGREKLREFAESVGETDPVYHDEEAAHAAGHPDIPAVPTFPIVLTGRVAAVQVRGRHELLAIETRVTTEEGEPVCSAVMTLIARGTAAAEPAAAAPPAPEASAEPDPGASAEPTGGSA